MTITAGPQAAADTFQLSGQQLTNMLDSISDGFIAFDRDWRFTFINRAAASILLNLLSNAVKYNRQGGTVTVSCTQAHAGWLRLNIRDTGLGIGPDQIAQLFVPFERLAADRASIEGTGLGLALSKRLVELMGGAIGVESVVGEGSTFWVELRVSADPAEQAADQIGDMAAFARDVAPEQTHTILYIEDNLSNLQLIEEVLATLPGIRLLPAMQGSLGLELAHTQHPSLILLDLHLPDIPGAEVLHRLQNAPDTRAIPVVVISASGMQPQIQRLLAAGAHTYLTKPINIKRLLATIDAIIQLANKGI